MTLETTPDSVLDRVNALRQQLAGLTTLPTEEERVVSTGCSELDQLLPGGSLRPGMLIEWLVQERGSGAATLAMHVAKQAMREHAGHLVVTDRWRRFYPPGATARQIEANDLIVVRSNDTKIMSAQEELWAIDQALRCPAVSVVLTWVDKIDPRAFRRMQLAAEAGQTLLLLIRSASVRAQPTWSDVQLSVTPCRPPSAESASHLDPNNADTNNSNHARPTNPAAVHENRHCKVTLLRQRGRAGSNTLEGASVTLEINELAGTVKGISRPHETRTMHMAPRVAHPATHRRSAGA